MVVKLGIVSWSMQDIWNCYDSNKIDETLFSDEISIVLGLSLEDIEDRRPLADRSVTLVFSDDFDY